MVLITPPGFRYLKSFGEVPRRLRGLGMTSKAGRAKTGRESKKYARR